MSATLQTISCIERESIQMYKHRHSFTWISTVYSSAMLSFLFLLLFCSSVFFCAKHNQLSIDVDFINVAAKLLRKYILAFIKNIFESQSIKVVRAQSKSTQCKVFWNMKVRSIVDFFFCPFKITVIVDICVYIHSKFVVYSVNVLC